MTAPSWVVHHGDCLDVMRSMPAASVDAVVCDPPYGLEFMGKDWDAPWKQGFAEFGMKDGNRRAAPVFGSKRNPVCLTCRKHKRGSKRCACETPDFDETPATFAQSFGLWCEGWAVEALRVAKPGAHLLAFGGTRTFHRLTCAIEDAGWEIRDCLSWLYGSGFPKSHNGAWGGTALKPAWEPIILARKPLIGTVEANHAAHGTGALNIDGCRIEGANAGGSGQPPLKMGGTNHRPFHDTAIARDFDTSKGRWPANVCLDAEAAAALDEQVGATGGHDHREFQGGTRPGGFGNVGAHIGDRAPCGPLYDDTGGASRFFYTAKASRGEREAGLDGHANGVLARSNGAKSADPVDAGAGSFNTARIVKNTHPTVKPVDLMRWLVRLVTPVGGLVLDPFLGSGTTGVAALEEGCRFIGIEREAEYVAIARARIAAAANAPMFNFGGS